MSDAPAPGRTTEDEAYRRLRGREPSSPCIWTHPHPGHPCRPPRQSAECLRCLGTRIVYTCADQSACDEACEKAPCPECRPRQSADRWPSGVGGVQCHRCERTTVCRSYTGYVICGTCGPLHPKSLTDACDQGGCPRLQTCYDAFGGWCAEHGTRESVLARESAARP